MCNSGKASFNMKAEVVAAVYTNSRHEIASSFLEEEISDLLTSLNQEGAGAAAAAAYSPTTPSLLQVESIEEAEDVSSPTTHSTKQRLMRDPHQYYRRRLVLAFLIIAMVFLVYFNSGRYSLRGVQQQQQLLQLARDDDAGQTDIADSDDSSSPSPSPSPTEQSGPPEPLEPFQRRNPDKYFPDWVKKPHYSWSDDVPDDKRVCFVHTGKAGGSTIGCSLGFELHCGDNKHDPSRIPAGLLPQYTTHQFHNEIDNCPDSPLPAYYLFVVRDPLERVQSAFIYDYLHHNDPPGKHGQTKLYNDCPFGTLNELALNGLAPNGIASPTCKRRAVNAITGKERFGYHLWMNYEWYVKDSIDKYPSVKPLVIRINHVQDDWKSAENALGNYNVTAPQMEARNQGDHSHDDTERFLSSDAKLLLCAALCHEIQVYKSLLHRAINLTPEQVLQSLDELAENCPWEAQHQSCSEDR